MTIIPFKRDYLSTELSINDIISRLKKHIDKSSSEFTMKKEYDIVIKEDKIRLKVRKPNVNSLGIVINQHMILKLKSNINKTNISLITRFSCFAYFWFVIIFLILGFASFVCIADFIKGNLVDFKLLIPLGILIIYYIGITISINTHFGYVFKDFSNMLKWNKIKKHSSTLCSINGGCITFRKVRFPYQPSNGLKGDSPAIRH